MRCEACGGDSGVLESRPIDDGRRIRRRRECASCRSRWTTEEAKTSLATRGPEHAKNAPEATRGHPLVVLFFRAKAEQNVSYEEIARRSGVAVKTMKNWRRHPAPNLSNIEPALSVLGWEIAAQRTRR